MNEFSFEYSSGPFLELENWKMSRGTMVARDHGPTGHFPFFELQKGQDEYSKLNSFITTLTLVELACYFFSS